MVRGLNRALRAAAKSGSNRPSKDDASVAVDPSEPRSFPHHVKEACWNKAALINGRDPARWRRDHLGNIVFRKLVACPGCLCYEFDHIIPYSKGGRSNLENCQVLQSSANRAKGNKVDTSMTELIQGSAYCRLSGKDMDIIELSAYGDIHYEGKRGICNIQ